MPACVQVQAIRVLGVLAASSLLYFAIKKLCSRKRKQYKKDTVILHQFGRGKTAPSLSPFPLKIETFLRIAKIPYENDFDDPMGPKGKCPWITYNDQEIADSTICINFLKKEFKKDLDTHLTTEQKAIGTAFRIMTEEHIYWCFIMERYVYDIEGRVRELSKSFPQSKLIFKIMARGMKSQAYNQGMARHTQQEVFDFLKTDLKALSDFLGNKKYFFGDRVSDADCAIFGMLVQLIWGPHGAPQQLLKEQFPNLEEFCLTMKRDWWPDWDQVLEK